MRQIKQSPRDLSSLIKLFTVCGWFAIATLFAACTWVNENKAGIAVAVVDAKEIRNCAKKGNISVEVKSQLGFIKRSARKVGKELEILARNEAIALEANTLVLESNPERGQRTYSAYDCNQ